MRRVLFALAMFGMTGGLLLAQEGDKPGAGEEPKKAKTPAPAEAGKGARVKMETSLGDIVLELNAEKAPITVDNFLQYVDAGYFDGTIFHRVMSTFMIQGGGYMPDLKEKKEGQRPPIKNEWKNGLKNDRGTIAMARSGPDTATSQFFINVVNNDRLSEAQADGAAYCVFGKVVEGMETVDKIKDTEVKTDPKLPMGKVVPVEPVVIKSVKRVEAGGSESPEKKP